MKQFTGLDNLGYTIRLDKQLSYIKKEKYMFIVYYNESSKQYSLYTTINKEEIAYIRYED